jgi:hypothetical protein
MVEQAVSERVQQIKDLIEEARQAKELSNDQARVASVALNLEENDAMLACRLVCQGADPASLDYIDTGDVDELVMEAHKNGPGVYKADDPNRLDYLALCALSADESKGTTGVRGRFHGFLRAMQVLGMEDPQLREDVMEGLGKRELEKIQNLPYVTNQVLGTVMRIYTTDRGFAQAAWAGQSVAAVLGTGHDGKPYLALGAPPYCPTLKEQGIEVDKDLYPRFGIVSNPDEVGRVMRETDLTPG